MADGVYTIRGKAFYAKVLGKPVANYNKDGFEWTLELQPNEAGKRVLKELGLDDRINKGENKDRIRFTQKERKLNGDPNKPISVKDIDGHAWDQNKLIGNESIIDLKFNYKDYGKGKKAGVYPAAIRVLEHIPYERQEFAPLDENDEYYRPRDDEDWGDNDDDEPEFDDEDEQELDDDIDDVV